MPIVSTKIQSFPWLNPNFPYLNQFYLVESPLSPTFPLGTSMFHHFFRHFPQVFVICVWLLWLPCLKPLLCRAGIIPDPANLVRSFQQVRCSTANRIGGSWERIPISGWWVGTCSKFSYIGKNNLNWPMFFPEGLKPPIRYAPWCWNIYQHLLQ